MLVIRAHKYRLDPTPEQAAFFTQTAGACRALYNLALEQRSQWWRPGRTISLKTQLHELTPLRAEIEWMRAAPVHALQSALKDLDHAYKRFFEGKSGYPNFKKKGVKEGFHLKGRQYLGFKRLTRNNGAVRLPKIGWVRLRGYRPLGGQLRNATITKRAEHWYVSITWRQERQDPTPSHLPPVGIDRGVAIFAACSTGVNYTSGAFFKRLEAKLKAAQIKFARQTKGSANWRKTKVRVAKMYAHMANARADFLHKTSLAIANSHGMVTLEKLQINNITKSARGTPGAPGKNIQAKARLNRSMLDKGWGYFAEMLEYKLSERGGYLVRVPARYTSQTCSSCGTVNKNSRISRSAFLCVHCGYSICADTNAARNILAAGHAVSACGSNRSGGRKQELLGWRAENAN